MDYFPYGKVLREYKPGEAEKFLTTYHQRDHESGLDYRGARFYDSDIGKFLSVDPLAADFASWSTYAYVLNNPLRYIDPDGRAPENVIIPINTTSETKRGFGHARIAVDQYRAVDNNGTTYYERTGNVIVYDLAPVTEPTAFQALRETGVEANYTRSVENKADFLKSQQESYDGVLEIVTTPENESGQYTQAEIQGDLDVMNALDGAVSGNAPYVATTNNCASLVCTGLSPIINTEELGKETVKVGMGIASKTATITTPNKVFKDLKGQSNVNVLKDAGKKANVTAQDYVDQFWDF